MVIKDLWNSHLSQQPCKRTGEEIELAEKTMECQERLLASLSSEQTALFEEYSELSNALDAIAAERAFETGVRFGTEYILETFGK